MAKKIYNWFWDGVLFEFVRTFLLAIFFSIFLQMRFGKYPLSCTVCALLFAILYVYFKYAPKDSSRDKELLFEKNLVRNKAGTLLPAAERKAMAGLDKKRAALFDNIRHTAFVSFLVCIFVSIPVQMTFRENWPLCIIISLFVSIFAAYAGNESGIAELARMEQTCRKCGYLNRRDTYYCAKCGKAVKFSHERIMRVYAGNNVMGTIVLQALKDNGIIAWKNTYWQGALYLPAYVYVFDENSEQAVKIVKLLDAKSSGPTNLLKRAAIVLNLV